MINYIYIDGSGHKKARPVSNREEYVEQRNAPENVENFRQARAGDAQAKTRLVQYNYNDLLPDGVLKGCCHAASTFAHDIDCGDEQACKAIAGKLLAMKDAVGLLELSVSSGWGLHAVCRRQPGRTILECQVRLSRLTQTEMDTSAHDEQRVLFTGPADAETLLFLASRAQLVAETIRPALAAGTWVLCDRFADSTFAYQGYGRGLNLSELKALNAFATGGLVPDRTILLDVPPETAAARLRARQQTTQTAADRMERAGDDFHARLKAGFLELAAAEPERFAVIAAEGSVESVAEKVWNSIRHML